MDFFRRLMLPMRWRTICMTALIVAIILCFLGYLEDNMMFHNGAYLAVAVALIGNFAFWRCPRCHKTLPMKDMMHLERCPHCKADVKNYYG